ncbi:glycosyltransferase [Thioalkalivibrio thiocyanodenitrificans]|uniref:glycosyltransferase n=1 Tax=Thioalkalivibrio thiocyanodenitrificans TaxID=243063 RepID=UPI0003684F26|nr:glycosyltransferase [Thioalkalivibrio thiocyanodenitrificans]
MRVVLWGTYDNGKPRVRIIRRGLTENGIEVIECHREVWGDIEDKSQVHGWLSRLVMAGRWLLTYPWLISCYLRAPRHDAVVVGYMGQMDVLVLWPFARLRGVPIVWDAFLSLYNTVVEDRCLLRKWHPVAWLLYVLEWLACRAADRVVLDTRAHADYFVATFGCPAERTDVVWVGAEQEAFPVAAAEERPAGVEKIALFYGQFIPLHGIETIIHAARETKNEAIHWIIIGSGQEAGRIRKMLDESPLPRVKWLPWVRYLELAHWIRRADVCLGIFGDTDKAARVIPNKVFQILMSGKPLITRDSPAIRELVGSGMTGIALVPPADAVALAQAVRASPECEPGLHAAVRARISPVSIGRRMTEVIGNTAASG